MYFNPKYFTFYPDFVEDIFKITKGDQSTWMGIIIIIGIVPVANFQ